MRDQIDKTALALCAISLAGCATVPYRYGVTRGDPRLADSPPLSAEEQIVRGRPHPILDRADYVWPGSWLRKLVLLDRRVDSHEIDEHIEAVIRRYLEQNELRHVKVRLNAYHVRDEWRRLVRNRSVGAGWRYTMGALSWLQYTLLPGRIFGGDHYNPYTNTIHLYSNIPAIAVHEGGHAKDFANRRWKGTYAFLYSLPFVALYHEAMATNDALGYLRAEESLELQREGYRILYPAYGTYVGGAAGNLVPATEPTLYVSSVATGHILGRLQARTLTGGPATESRAPSSPADGTEPE